MTFFVPGLPQQQGSKTKWGTEENPHVIGWRESIAREAHALMGEEPLFDGPIRLRCIFYFPRPKSHYRTGKFSGEIRKNAPPYHTSPPDLDKLMRAIGDALTATAIRDDRQIANSHALKIYSSARVGVQITVEQLANEYTQGTLA